jgi:hypothetical protein
VCLHSIITSIHLFMYLPAYSIASESARSKVANAVRRGVAAHEIDDVKDTY